jgi:hypothetical protein
MHGRFLGAAIASLPQHLTPIILPANMHDIFRQADVIARIFLAYCNGNRARLSHVSLSRHA